MGGIKEKRSNCKGHDRYKRVDIGVKKELGRKWGRYILPE